MIEHEGRKWHIKTEYNEEYGEYLTFVDFCIDQLYDTEKQTIKLNSRQMMDLIYRNFQTLSDIMIDFIVDFTRMSYAIDFFYESYNKSMEKKEFSNIYNIRIKKGKKYSMIYTQNGFNKIPLGISKEERDKLYPTKADFDKNFYNNKNWILISNFILIRDNDTCQICGKKPANHVHHRRSAYYNPETCFDPDILMTLCDKCHLKK